MTVYSILNVFILCLHKLKQCSSLILHDKNSTSFVVSVLVHKMGEGDGHLFKGEGTFKFWHLLEGCATCNSRIYGTCMLDGPMMMLVKLSFILY